MPEQMANLRILRLGEFTAPPKLSPRLQTFGVKITAIPDLSGIGVPLTDSDLLLCELAWLDGLSPADAETLCRFAQGAAAWVMLADVAASFETRIAWLRRGVSHCFAAPLDPDRLASLVEEIHDRRNGPPLRVLLVRSDVKALNAQAEALRAAGYEVLASADTRAVLALHDQTPADILVADYVLPACRGPELATLLRQRSLHARLPAIYLYAAPPGEVVAPGTPDANEVLFPQALADDRLITAIDAHARRYRAWLRKSARSFASEARALLRLEQLRHAIDAHAIVSVTDTAGTILEVNEKFCAISGYSRAELIGQNHRIVKSNLHPPELYATLWQTITAGRVWHGELCNRRKDGSLYWVAATIVPICASNGEPTQYISIRTDISRLKAQEEALRVSEERLRRSQIYANIGTWDWNIETGELYWSERIAPLFGYAEGELATTYENFLAAVHPEDRAAVIAAVNACIERDVPYEIEHRVVWPNGEVRWLLERGAVTRDATGKPLRMLGVVQDIDARKRAELALIESERRLTLAIEGPGDGVWDWNIQTGEMPLAANYEGMLGYARGEIEPTIAAWEASVHPEDLPAVKTALAEYLEGQRPEYAVELRMRCKNGAYKWILCRGTLVERDAQGRPLRMIGIHSDISARKAMEAELVAAREAAERANRAKSDFLSSMSHELRTPMHAIIGFAQILESDPTLDADQHDNVREILRAGRHLLSLINEVLDLAKIEAGRIDLNLESFDLAPLVQECLQLVAPLAAPRAIQLAADTTDEALRVYADRNRLRQSLLNLLSNAIKYNRETGAVNVRARATHAGRVRIEVQDTGIGIAPEKQAELFQPFNRLGQEASAIEGTGIGLSITRRLIELMGGEIGVASAVDQGSTFWIELNAGDDGASSAANAEAAAPLIPACGEDKAVLAIDDNPINLKLIAQMLGRICPHLRFLSAHEAALGLTLARAHRPSVIVLDIQMPGMDGYAFLHALRADPELARTPVIAVTAQAMPEDLERGRAAGFCAYLPKPLDLSAFRAALLDCLRSPPNAD